MKINVKSFNVIFKWLYILFVLSLFADMTVLYIFSMQTENAKTGFIFDMATIGCVVLFLISLGAPVFLLAHAMKNIDNNIKRLINQNNYDAAFELLKGYAQKRHTATLNQLILYYLGYTELLRNNVDCAVDYLRQVKTKNYSTSTLNCTAQAVAFLYIVYKLTKKSGFEEIRQIYKSEKNKLISAVSRNKNPNVAKVIKLYEAIGYFEEGQTAAAANKLKDTPYINIPLIQKFCDENDNL